MELLTVYSKMQQKFIKQPYPCYQQRKKQLKTLQSLIKLSAEPLAQALDSDFGTKENYETYLLELFPVINCISFCIKNLKAWMKERKRKTSWYFLPAQVSIEPQPLGVIGIIVPWNYPLYLALIPICYALSAGNKVMVKMSEYTPNINNLLDKIFSESELNDEVKIITGDVNISRQFVNLPFDHLLFTGSTEVGRQVMQIAAQNLTAVTLELGGKSPVVISDFSEHYLPRLLLGKYFNAGQTCVAPDYILLARELEHQFISSLQQYLSEFTLKVNQCTSIATPKQKQRMQELLADAKQKGAKIYEFKFSNNQSFYFVVGVDKHMTLMQDEIFLPILPIICYDDFTQAIQFINDLPNPLLIYYFGNNKKEISCLKHQTKSGGITINDTLIQNAIDDLPFGGVGHSGMGKYRGREGFDTFSNLKSIFIQKNFSLASLFYPPYGILVYLFLKYFTGLKIKKPNNR